jgi:hypothetical protein
MSATELRQESRAPAPFGASDADHFTWSGARQSFRIRVLEACRRSTHDKVKREQTK